MVSGLMMDQKMRAGLVLLALAGMMIGAFLFNELNMLLIGIMVVLATIGVFALLAFAAGLLSISSRNDPHRRSRQPSGQSGPHAHVPAGE